MPLIKSTSKKALGQNIATEVNAGRPQKQAEAIAFSEQRRARKPKHVRRKEFVAAALGKGK